MPTITFEKEDLERLVGKTLRLDDLEEMLAAAKATVEDVVYEEGRTILEVEVGDSNRPDLWSVEGIARLVRALLGIRPGLPEYRVRKPRQRVIVEKTVLDVRPHIACAIVRGVKLGRAGYESLIQLQEKLMHTYGRRRRKVAIGTSNADMITFPVHYRGVDPHSVRFVPLYESVEMDLAEILEKTEKGQEYRFILEGRDVYPVLLDDRGRVISFPPIINSNDIGRIDARTENIFVDVTGTDPRSVRIALNVIVTALAERGGEIEAVTVEGPRGKEVTPDLRPREITVDAAYVSRLSGVTLRPKEIARLLDRVGLGVRRVKGTRLDILYPAFRGDIMGPRDVLEDILIALGYNALEPETPNFFTVGGLQRITILEDAVREILVGFGAQEILSFVLTSPETLRKAKTPGTYAEIENPVSSQYSVLRNAILPVLLDFLSQNTRVSYPQRVFEVGDVVVADEDSPTGLRTESHVAYASAHAEATFTEARQVLEALLRALGVEFSVSPYDHPTFIEGRCAALSVRGEAVAVVGEVHPAVLEAFGMEMPVAAFELNISRLKEVMGW